MYRADQVSGFVRRVLGQTVWLCALTSGCGPRQIDVAAQGTRGDQVWYEIPFVPSPDLEWHRHWLRLDLRSSKVGITRIRAEYWCSGRDEGGRVECAERCPGRGEPVALILRGAERLKVPLSCERLDDDVSEDVDRRDEMTGSLDTADLLRITRGAKRIAVELEGSSSWRYRDLASGELGPKGTATLDSYLDSRQDSGLSFLGARDGCEAAKDCLENHDCRQGWCVPMPKDRRSCDDCDLDEVCVKGTCIAP